MKNEVGEAYRAFPDRVFLVRKDGRLIVVADRGPRGFAPALTKANRWLEEFKRAGVEPVLPDDAQEPGRDRQVTSDKPEAETHRQPEATDNESSTHDSPKVQSLESRVAPINTSAA